MSLIGDPAIAGHSGWNRFPGLVRYVHPPPVGGVVRMAPVLRRRGPDRWQPYNPQPYIPIHEPIGSQVAQYTGTNTQTRTKSKRRYKKRTCCRYIKGKKYCSPRFCPKRKYKKFYWY